MFGLTSQSNSQYSRPTNGRITQNSREEIRHNAGSSTYDNSASERMKIEYLRKEKDRRDKERNKLMYDGKKREYDRLVQEEERTKTESRRLESELVKYTHDVEGVKLQEKREASGIPLLKKEQLDLSQKIQKTENELLQYKNRHQRVVQELSKLEQTDKSINADLHKREIYVAGIKTKFDIVKTKHIDVTKQIEKLKSEVESLRRLI